MVVRLRCRANSRLAHGTERNVGIGTERNAGIGAAGRWHIARISEVLGNPCSLWTPGTAGIKAGNLATGTDRRLVPLSCPGDRCKGDRARDGDRRADRRNNDAPSAQLHQRTAATLAVHDQPPRLRRAHTSVPSVRATITHRPKQTRYEGLNTSSRSPGITWRKEGRRAISPKIDPFLEPWTVLGYVAAEIASDGCGLASG